MRHGTAENKAARFDARDLVDLAAGPRLHQFVDRAAKRARVAEQGRDVAEHDPGLWIIGNRADRGFEIVFEDGLVIIGSVVSRAEQAQRRDCSLDGAQAKSRDSITCCQRASGLRTRIP